MKDIRIDAQGEQRCWNCGSRNFTQKRTLRAKAIGGVAGVATLGLAAAATPLATKKKLKCQACDEYNDVGSSKPWKGPANARLAEKLGTADIPAAPPARSSAAPRQQALSVADELSKLAALRDAGVLTIAEFETQKARLLS